MKPVGVIGSTGPAATVAFLAPEHDLAAPTADAISPLVATLVIPDGRVAGSTAWDAGRDRVCLQGILNPSAS